MEGGRMCREEFAVDNLQVGVCAAFFEENCRPQKKPSCCANGSRPGRRGVHACAEAILSKSFHELIVTLSFIHKCEQVIRRLKVPQKPRNVCLKRSNGAN
ncbi:hypothetical protein JOB18_034051 [Solea senegalensis]|uniref:Uncharacterized protein n=1 Tax=Solea senegalensis TaxID=28829 RepID=A0AAV6RTQ4_SOLSE|nr:hypothetical protein JOB18_034051 [Solea senegalensis]